MRKVSENKEFPFLSKSLCYYELLNNNLEDLSRDENLLKNAYIRAKNGESKIYITWHGNYRTDMFEDWESTLQKKYCTLIWLEDVKTINPLEVPRSNGAGWIVLKN